MLALAPCSYRLLAIDCEGVNLGRKGSLCLIQIATAKHIFIFDITASGSKMFENGLKTILENSSNSVDSSPASPSRARTMIWHDCRQDSDALFHLFNVRLGRVFDAQTAHAILLQARGVPAPELELFPIGLNALLLKYAGTQNQYKEAVREMLKAEPRLWEKRPLSDVLIQYAAHDVCHLYEVYQKLVTPLVPTLPSAH